jgi:hypothetical protein
MLPEPGYSPKIETPPATPLRVAVVIILTVTWPLFCLWLLANDPYGPHMQ